MLPYYAPFVHWVAYNIPAGASGLPRGTTRDAEITGIISLEGMINGVYALDADLALVPGLNAEELRAAMDGHVLASGMLMGHYERK